MGSGAECNRLSAKWVIVAFTLVLSAWSCGQMQSSDLSDESPAADPEVADFMERFEGRGQQVDASKLPTAEEILQDFNLAPGLVADLVLAEPDINQPVEIAFDHRGRLWVVQYSQYPYPAGLKVTDIDHHIRMTFDRVPEPPPNGVQGADKITFFEDSNGDGRLDKATDAITGLNIVTAVTWGRGQIWVLNPPYLLSYPDENDDGLPDDAPKVCIKGFGLEDTHAVANSLCWGPDGWLYGATGSTTHQYISTSVTETVHYKGQGIWRYHPTSEVFEIFSEGGGNTFHVEIDAKGRIYSGTNGTSRGQYYKQGAYYGKNWGKHGALTNDYAYGNLPDMEFQGERLRFTHAWVKYQATALPQYQNKLLAINPLHNFVLASEFTENGSTFATTDVGKVLESTDRWFRPVDIKVGPDGAVYLADWSDSRLSHVNPRDDWHKTSGRVYRIRGQEPVLLNFDFSQMTDQDLIEQLSSEDKWFRQQALRILGDRKNQELVPQLLESINSAEPQLALEYLWAAVLSGGVTEDIVRLGLNHPDPYVRLWTVRLTTDGQAWPGDLHNHLLMCVEKETHPEVLGQMASSAKRMDTDLALEVLWALLPRINVSDPDNPLLLWWALEHHLDGGMKAVQNWLQDPMFWELSVVRQCLLPRMMQRSLERRTDFDFGFAVDLFDAAPSRATSSALLEGFLQGTSVGDLADIPSKLLEATERIQSNSSVNSLGLQIRHGQSEAVDKAVTAILSDQTLLSDRLTLVEALAGVQNTGVRDALLSIMKDRSAAKTLVAASIRALSQEDDPAVGEAVLNAYPDHLRAHSLTKSTALHVIAQRVSWAGMLMDRILKSRQIEKEDVSRSEVLQLRWSLGEEWYREVDALWPEYLLPNEDAKEEEMDRVADLLRLKKGDPVRGKSLFSIFCGSCHRLHGEGNSIGPDLTGYDRGNTDYLVSHTIDPDLDVREGYVQFVLKTIDDRSFVGVISERSNQLVTIRPYLNDPLSFRMDEVALLEPIEQSMMPSGLLSNLPDDQIRDLFAYLAGPALD